MATASTAVRKALDALYERGGASKTSLYLV